MNGNGARTALLAFCISALSCLLFAGAPRLVGGDERPVEVSRARWDGVCLTAPERSEETRCAAREEAPAGQREAAVCPSHESAPALCGVYRDANGNVLGARSYVRAVYRAFALGDGFV